MKQYHDLLNLILEQGVVKSDRTGVGTISIFGHQSRYNLNHGFPLLTTKKMHWPGVVDELLWFLSGSTNALSLPERTQKWWTPWADKDGRLGRIYGAQWRAWTKPNGLHLDQIKSVIAQIKNTPESRRHLVITYNPGEVDKMNLPPCHGIAIQFYVVGDKLSCQMYQRSGDAFLGVPVNIASYSLLLKMVAQVTGLIPYEFIHVLGDAHIYLNHIQQVKTLLSREILDPPSVKLNTAVKDIDNFKFEDISLEDYKYWPAIKAPIAV